LLLWGLRDRKTVWTFSENIVKAGALGAALSDPETLGMETADFVRDLLQNNFQDILQNRLPVVAKATGRSLEDISQALKTIAQLNSRPGGLFSHELVPGVVPDLSVHYEGGRYRVVANDARAPNLYIRREYRELLRRRDIDPKLRDYVREKVRAAQWLMEAIEQRRLTVTRIAQAIVDHQAEFMEKGQSRLRPLKMQDVAGEVGVHVATVSRAVAGKYLDTPLGIYELRHFFTGGLVTAAGTEASYDAVKHRVLGLVEQEHREKPLSDQAIVERLKAEGIDVARRTITKYRQELRIPAARLRRQYTSGTPS
jgi:RNA polymerase sigma-54 factor